MSAKVIFKRAEVFVLAEVCLPRRPHVILPRSQVFSEKRNGGARGRLMNVYIHYVFSKCMRTSRKTDFRSSKNNFRGHIPRAAPGASLSVPLFSLDRLQGEFFFSLKNLY